MIMLISRFAIDPYKRAAFMVFAKGMVTREQQHLGCLGSGIFEDISAPNYFLMVEQWEDETALNAYGDGPVFAHDDEVLATFLIAEPVFAKYEV